MKKYSFGFDIKFRRFFKSYLRFLVAAQIIKCSAFIVPGIGIVRVQIKGFVIGLQSFLVAA